jgi:hypothetical protein
MGRRKFTPQIRTVTTDSNGTVKAVKYHNNAPPTTKSAASPIAGADAALDALKNSLATENARKLENTYVTECFVTAKRHC